MSNVQRRLEKIEQQINEVLGPPPPTPAEQEAAAAEWNRLVTPWAETLLESMAPEHYHLVTHWAEHLLQHCHEKPCDMVPPGLMDTLWKLWSWKGDASKPVALPACVVEVYLTNDRLNTRPHVDCEDCGYILPISFFFVQSKQVNHFPLCPLCHGTTGWHAHNIKLQVPGYKNLIPYSQRSQS